MTAVAWALAGLSLLFAPGAGRPVGIGRRRRAAPRRAGAGPTLAVIGVAVACLVTAGPWPGGAAAAVLCPAAVALIRRAASRPPRIEADPALPLCLDLVAAALRSGRPLSDALTLAAPAARPDVAGQLTRVATLLRLGADPPSTWSALHDPQLTAVASAAARSSESGIKLAEAFERVAADLRAERSAAAAVRAHRAGVRAMAPLAACFLPSFVCLGVVPVVVGVAATVLGTVA